MQPTRSRTEVHAALIASRREFDTYQFADDAIADLKRADIAANHQRRCETTTRYAIGFAISFVATLASAAWTAWAGHDTLWPVGALELASLATAVTGAAWWSAWLVERRYARVHGVGL